MDKVEKLQEEIKRLREQIKILEEGAIIVGRAKYGGNLYGPIDAPAHSISIKSDANEGKQMWKTIIRCDDPAEAAAKALEIYQDLYELATILSERLKEEE